MSFQVMLHVENDLEMFKLKVFRTYVTVNTFHPLFAFYWMLILN